LATLTFVKKSLWGGDLALEQPSLLFRVCALAHGNNQEIVATGLLAEFMILNNPQKPIAYDSSIKSRFDSFSTRR